MAGHVIKWADFLCKLSHFLLSLEIVEILCVVRSHWQPKHGFQPQGDVYRVLLKLAKDCEDMNMGFLQNI